MTECAPEQQLARHLMAYVSGQSRDQATLFPVALGDLVPEDHLVRVIDAFVAGLDLRELGFGKAQPAATGRPPYDPGDLLKLYLYGYLNQVRSSRRLERECGRNVELIWLLNRLSPDHKTIADFRRLNAAPFKAVCRSFVRFCAEAELIGGQWVAIDGSKFQAVASKRSAVTDSKLEVQLKNLDGQVQSYLESLDQADEAEAGEVASDKQAVRDALARLQERRADIATTREILKELKTRQHVVGEPEAKIMKMAHGFTAVAYNVQSAVDAKNKLIVHHELTNEANDTRSLAPMAKAVKDALNAQALNVVADGGYLNGEHAESCEQAGISPYVPVQRSQNNQGGGTYFDRSAFAYDKDSDSYRCPAGEVLTRKCVSKTERQVIYTTPACGGCALKAKCTSAKQRSVSRHFDEEAFERMAERMRQFPQAMALRRETAEHPFANLKHRILGNGRFLLRGMTAAAGELALAVLAYNFRRALNLLGQAAMKQKLAAIPA
jgi:transposase